MIILVEENFHLLHDLLRHFYMMDDETINSQFKEIGHR